MSEQYINANEPAGLYGKLPTHGDFIQRNLPSDFVSEWDQWLQLYMSGTREKLGESWLDIYLTSPVWHFVLSRGVIDNHQWAGLMIPSVDQVGRYFPFTIAAKLQENLNPLDFISMQTVWFDDIENLALTALDGEITLDDLANELASLEQPAAAPYQLSGSILESYSIQMEVEFEEQSVSSVYSYLLDALLIKNINSYSAWRTTGSDSVAPCFFTSQGLPTSSRFPAMLDGNWDAWGWQKPYSLMAC